MISYICKLFSWEPFQRSSFTIFSVEKRNSLCPLGAAQRAGLLKLLRENKNNVINVPPCFAPLAGRGGRHRASASAVWVHVERRAIDQGTFWFGMCSPALRAKIVTRTGSGLPRVSCRLCLRPWAGRNGHLHRMS